MQSAPRHALETPASAEVIVAVVVTYNRFDQIKRTVTRLLEASVDHVVIVDNGSTDGTRVWLAKADAARLIIDLPEKNLGGAGGFARGMDLAHERFDPDWVLLMDDDARPMPGAIDAFRNMDRSEWDAVAAAVYDTKGRICEMNRPSRNPFWSVATFAQTLLQGGRKGFHVGDAAFQQGTVTEIDVSSFVGLFLSRRAMGIGGRPDPKMFIYGDDVLYSLAVRRGGGRMAIVADITFEHDCETGPDSLTAIPLWKRYYLIRNKIVVYRDVAGPLFWAAFPVLLWVWFRAARAYPDATQRYRKMMWRAVRDGLRKNFDRSHSDVLTLTSDRQDDAVKV